MATEPFTIDAAPVYGPTGASPPLPHGFGLAFSLYAAVTPDKQPTIALFAAGLVPGEYQKIYGGRLAGAINIVCIDTANGAAFSRNGERRKPVPLPLAMNPDPGPPEPDEAEITSAQVFFGVDLRKHLRLPPHAAEYTVFLWLDRMISTPQVVQFPPGAGEERAIPYSIPAADIQYRAVSHAPAATLPAFLEREGHGLGIVRLPDTPVPLTLLGLDFRSRELHSYAYALPDGQPGDIVGFDVLLPMLFGGPGWMDAEEPPNRAFLLAAMPGAISDVVVIEK